MMEASSLRPQCKIYPQALLGYRGFALYQGRLRSLIADTFWRSGVNVAECHICAAHRPAVQDCSCGFYAYHAVHSAIDTVEGAAQLTRMMPEAMLIGAVAGRGAVQVHGQGWRAQEAQILVLADVFGAISEDQLQDLGALYHVPAFKSVNRLQWVASGYAKPADLDLLPDDGQLPLPGFN